MVCDQWQHNENGNHIERIKRGMKGNWQLLNETGAWRDGVAAERERENHGPVDLL